MAIYCENWCRGNVLHFIREVAWDKPSVDVCTIVFDGENKPPLVRIHRRPTKKETDFIVRYAALKLKRA